MDAAEQPASPASSPAKPQRDASGRWLAGRSANPGGRIAPSADVLALARSHTSEAVATLASLMADVATPAAVRASAAVALLNRAWGTPPQSVAISVDPDAERRALLRAAFSVYYADETLLQHAPQHDQEGGDDENLD